jgi:hypothetical protein
MLVANAAYFILGAIWYSPKVIGTAWMKANNLSMPDGDNRPPMAPFLIRAFIYSLFIVFAQCLVFCWGNAAACEGQSGLLSVILRSMVVSVLAIGGSSALHNNFLMKPIKATLIDLGYHLIAGAITATIFYYTCTCCSNV